jgi:hypothetical protein
MRVSRMRAEYQRLKELVNATFERITQAVERRTQMALERLMPLQPLEPGANRIDPETDRESLQVHAAADSALIQFGLYDLSVTGRARLGTIDTWWVLFFVLGSLSPFVMLLLLSGTGLYRPSLRANIAANLLFLQTVLVPLILALANYVDSKLPARKHIESYHINLCREFSTETDQAPAEVRLLCRADPRWPVRFVQTRHVILFIMLTPITFMIPGFLVTGAVLAIALNSIIAWIYWAVVVRNASVQTLWLGMTSRLGARLRSAVIMAPFRWAAVLLALLFFLLFNADFWQALSRASNTQYHVVLAVLVAIAFFQVPAFARDEVRSLSETQLRQGVIAYRRWARRHAPIRNEYLADEIGRIEGREATIVIGSSLGSALRVHGRVGVWLAFFGLAVAAATLISFLLLALFPAEMIQEWVGRRSRTVLALPEPIALDVTVLHLRILGVLTVVSIILVSGLASRSPSVRLRLLSNVREEAALVALLTALSHASFQSMFGKSTHIKYRVHSHEDGSLEETHGS